MLSAEEAVRAMLAAAFQADAGVMASVHRIYESQMPRMTPPYVWIGAADGRDWGTKDRAGREIMTQVMIMGLKNTPKEVAERVARCAAGIVGTAGGWEMVAARVMRSRWLPQKDGGWQSQMALRCRSLAAQA